MTTYLYSSGACRAGARTVAAKAGLATELLEGAETLLTGMVGEGC